MTWWSLRTGGEAAGDRESSRTEEMGGSQGGWELGAQCSGTQQLFVRPSSEMILAVLRLAGVSHSSVLGSQQQQGAYRPSCPLKGWK